MDGQTESPSPNKRFHEDWTMMDWKRRDAAKLQLHYFISSSAFKKRGCSLADDTTRTAITAIAESYFLGQVPTLILNHGNIDWVNTPQRRQNPCRFLLMYSVGFHRLQSTLQVPVIGFPTIEKGFICDLLSNTQYLFRTVHLGSFILVQLSGPVLILSLRGVGRNSSMTEGVVELKRDVLFAYQVVQHVVASETRKRN